MTSSDGVSLAVYESGDPERSTVLAVHGYPDNHTVWDGVVELLAERFHVVTYDVRGCGESDKPGARSAYRMEQLVADLAAVADAVSPDSPVHLLAHDWGSIQSWPAVTDATVGARIASFTSVSGPSLDYAAAWLRAVHKHPRASLGQLAHSYYIMLFQLPGLPELAARSGVLDRGVRLASRGKSSAAAAGEPTRSEADKVNGLSLYRANMLGRLGRPNPRPTSTPVQVVVPDRDAFVTADLAVEAAQPWAENLRVERVSGGHWVVSERPDVIARLAAAFIDGRGPARAAEPARHGRFAGQLAVVTGGARGIGRATALQFARAGADVVVADIDDVAAKETVGELRELGVGAWSAHLDVSDAGAWEYFATTVRDEHGTPDIVVNNAGIGLGGPFLGTSVADWQKILDVNLWSVIHGCRLFAAQMIERGQGGHIVNVASAAAYSPSVVYPAYATSKSAVLMLTECLRAELEREGIGVTAVCPGFINTDIARTTIHVGVDDETAAERSAHQVASYQRRGYTPEKVARQIVRAVAAGKAVAVITPEAKLLRAISRFAPALGRRVAKLDLNKI
ncbi:MAG TPA: SDR family oxidoreductase [Jatrophihabitans sp.]|uniref:SDR family oxidoreductase n=1 Tax=Jatrophihabitans sp. TaxID=1932789 RepID=UPI002DFBA3A8|nr:SDR family oxidoreductase [Jatrophihabitans sp.]